MARTCDGLEQDGSQRHDRSQHVDAVQRRVACAQHVRVTRQGQRAQQQAQAGKDRPWRMAKPIGMQPSMTSTVGMRWKPSRLIAQYTSPLPLRNGNNSNGNDDASTQHERAS